ncbi:unnamed protein product [Diatraea saccharalis]|uniref:Uncharacterized protein n=1 Tax=Diatraea saccharalis TaxID=40085 RepID=A0A9N9RHB2_9NEOP|nr:unnamed protein product [Diatraea saccharalis]
MLAANDDSQANTYEELSAEWEGGAEGGQYRVSRCAPCRGYTLCRLLPAHAKEKLDLSNAGAYEEGSGGECAEVGEAGEAGEVGEAGEAGEAGLDSGSCNSACSEAGDTYVITDARAPAYLVTRALQPRAATIIDPTRTQVRNRLLLTLEVIHLS